MNIAAYCRVSTDKNDQLNSLEAQKKFFDEYAGKNNYNLVRIYADEGISGTKIKNRTEFQGLLRDARRGLFEMVVVKDISRFARNTVDLLNSTRELKSLNIETVFLTSNMSLLGNSEFVLTIFGALAQEESANTSKRIKFGKKINAQKGRVPNIVFGYDKIKGDYFNLTINEFEANIVRRIFELYIDGGFGTNKIANILNNEGILTKRNCRWTQTAITRVITNELYTGVIINGKQEIEDFLTGTRKENDETDWLITEREDLAIIDKDVFNKANEILKSRGVAFSRNQERHSNKHLFSTLIKCSCCGYSFRRTERVYKKTYINWVCSGRNSHGRDFCNNAIKLDEAELSQALKDYFTEMLKTKTNVIGNIIKEFNRTYRSKNDNEGYKSELENRLKASVKIKQKYMNMYTDDLISREELKEKVGQLNTEIEKTENELKLIAYNLGKGEQLEIVLNKMFSDLETIMSMEHTTNTQLKQIIEKITVDEDGKIDVYLKMLSDLGLENNVLIDYYGT